LADPNRRRSPSWRREIENRKGECGAVKREGGHCPHLDPRVSSIVPTRCLSRTCSFLLQSLCGITGILLDTSFSSNGERLTYFAILLCCTETRGTVEVKVHVMRGHQIVNFSAYRHGLGKRIYEKRRLRVKRMTRPRRYCRVISIESLSGLQLAEGSMSREKPIPGVSFRG